MGIFVNPGRQEMPQKGWRYDVLVTAKGGRRPLKLGTPKSVDTANEIERECRRRLGLQKTETRPGRDGRHQG